MSGQLSLDGFAPPAPQAYSLFFALMPDAGAAAQAAAVSRTIASEQGQATGADRTARYHVTLFHVGHFAGEIPAGTMATAKTVAADLRTAPFDVAFDRAATFSGKPGNLPLVLLGAEREPALMAFQADLQSRLLRAGLTAGDHHRVFTPHLTLFYARHAVAERPVAPVHWRATSFVLLRSVIGQSRYIEEGRWPLIPSADEAIP